MYRNWEKKNVRDKGEGEREEKNIRKHAGKEEIEQKITK